MDTERFKRFIILHSNDMHGDFLAETQGAEGNLVGGLSLLSGYLNQVRSHEKNVLYLIAGDMLQGSMIDSEFKGVSTMEIMNYLAPDVVSLGNHELDYGLAHLLFLEKMANFPIVTANLYIKKHHKRLMRPYLILNVDGFDILFIGIVTEDVLNRIKLESDVGTFIGLEDASAEVGKICNAYKDEDIDLTILLTHIGYDADLKLAAMLKPEWGVDMIIGGHSHTILEQPAIVNDVIIAQAGVGTDQIGRFEIVVDDDTNSIVEWSWKLIPVNSDLAKPDEELQKYIDSFKDVVNRKYNAVITRLAQKLTHPARDRETSLGNLFADIIAERANADAAFLISGSIRGTELGPHVTLGDFRRVFPYDSAVYTLKVTGLLLKQIFRYNLASEERKRRILQVSRGVKVVYNDTLQDLESLTIDGKPALDESQYTICLQEYYWANSVERLGMSQEELSAVAAPKVLTTSIQDVVEEYLRNHQNLGSRVEGRLTFK